MADAPMFPVDRIPDFPFILLQQGDISEVARYLDTVRVSPRIRSITIDDYAIMSMVEKGIGISILPELILRRTSYRIVAKELSVPARRTIGFAVRDERSRLPKTLLRSVELIEASRDRFADLGAT